ncbi:MAG: T9SS type A sorting domain-containing protein [candidate division WOR-3 bacterium]|nr:T9SS type A sorting domain-containing protein [candidate division WOR-3 bacterium]
MIYLILNQMSLYGPESPDWLQGRHDYKKTGKSAWRCNQPAITNRLWHDKTSSDCFGAGGNLVVNVVMDINNNNVNEVLGAGNYTCPFIDNAVRLRVYPANSSNHLWELKWNGGATSADANVDAFMAGAYTSVGRRLFSVDYRSPFFGTTRRYFTAVNLTSSSGSVIYQRQDCQSDDICSSGLTVADVDNNGCPEIYRGVRNFAVAVNGCANSYTEIWSVNLGNRVGIPAIGKIDNNPDWDVIYPVMNNLLYVRRASDGSAKFSFTLPSNFPDVYGLDDYSTLISLYDIDNDGLDEVFVRTSTQLIALKYNGSSFNILWQQNYISSSALAIGPILSNNQIGIAFRNNSSLSVVRASDGALISNSGSSLCGAPTITDINGDGIWDVLISECGCGNPYGFSRTNNFSSPVWQAGGCAEEPPISSDLIVAKYYLNPDNTGKLVIVEGDQSCDTNVWMCDGAELVTPISVDEVYYKDGIFYIENYKGKVMLYNINGRLVYSGYMNEKLNLKIKPGVYFLKTENKSYKVVVN